jgi:hypothetical protein
MYRNLKIGMALMAAGSAAHAQDVTPTPVPQAADAASLILAIKPAESPAVPRPNPGTAYKPASAGISKDISAGMPAYMPAALQPTPGAAVLNVSDIDKPKNQIPRLPVEVMSRYVVHGSHLPVFRRKDLYTKAGLIDLSFKEHPGLLVGNFFNLNAATAYETVMNEELFAAKMDLAETANAMAIGGDSSETGAVQEAMGEESFESAGGQGGPVGVK